MTTRRRIFSFCSQHSALALALLFSTIALPIGFAAANDDRLAENVLDTQKKTAVKELVNEAKYQEIYGRTDLRNQLLEKAEQLTNGEDPKIHWMKGKVNDGIQWRTPQEIAEATTANKTHQQYIALRDKTVDNFQGHLQLAQWCQQNRLFQQRSAHLQRAMWHNPNNAQLRQLLGHRRINGRWVSPEDIADETRQFMISRQRFLAWQSDVNEIGELLADRSKKKQAEGLEKLRGLDDSTCVTALEAILARHNEATCIEVIRKLAQFEEVESSLALMRLALNGNWESCRTMATKALSKRDKYHYVPTLLSQLAGPVISRMNVIRGRRGQVLYQNVYYQKTMSADVVKQYDTVYQRVSSGLTNGLDSLRKTMRDIRESIPRDQWAVASNNFNIARQNDRITNVLTKSVGIDLGNNADDWWKWWNDYNEVFTESRPIDYDRIERSVVVYDADTAPTGGGGGLRRPTSEVSFGSGGECLVAGTLVWTDRGPQAVEKIRVGDQVLSQDIETGQLEYCSVIRPTVRPATPTFEIRLPDETIRASGGHPFWVAGKGWIKTRDLKSGMSLSCLDGCSLISEINKAESAKLYNLVVAGNANYFVGKSRILSHDNSIQQPTQKLVPGLSD